MSATAFQCCLGQAAAEAMERQLNRHISKEEGGIEVKTLVSPYTGETMKRFRLSRDAVRLLHGHPFGLVRPRRIRAHV